MNAARETRCEPRAGDAPGTNGSKLDGRRKGCEPRPGGAPGVAGRGSGLRPRNLPGAVLGGLLMGLSEEIVVAYLSSTYRDALAFGLLILILLFKPSGLLGRFRVEKV